MKTIKKNGQMYVSWGTHLTPAIKRTCQWCGDDFYTSKFAVGKFCGYACNLKNNRSTQIIRNVRKKCVSCKRVYLTPRRHSERRRTCGRPECLTKLRKKYAKQLFKDVHKQMRAGEVIRDDKGKIKEWPTA